MFSRGLYRKRIKSALLHCHIKSVVLWCQQRSNSDSYKIALASKKPDTARERFELAIEAYHQLISLGISGDGLSTIQYAVTILTKQFPALVFLR